MSGNQSYLQPRLARCRTSLSAERTPRDRQLCEASSLFEMHKIKELTHQPSEGGFVFFNTDIEDFIRRREGRWRCYQRPASYFLADDTGEDRLPHHGNVKSQRTRLDGQPRPHAFHQPFTDRCQQPFGCLQGAQVVLADRQRGFVRMRDPARLRPSFIRFRNDMRHPHSEVERAENSSIGAPLFIFGASGR